MEGGAGRYQGEDTTVDHPLRSALGPASLPSPFQKVQVAKHPDGNYPEEEDYQNEKEGGEKTAVEEEFLPHQGHRQTTEEEQEGIHPESHTY